MIGSIQRTTLMSLLVLLTTITVVTPKTTFSSGYCSLCMGDKGCEKTCNQLDPAVTHSRPVTTPNQSETRSSSTGTGYSKKWVRFGDYCEQFDDSKSGYEASAMGGVKCCCQGGISKPNVYYGDRSSSCTCRKPPTSAGEPCIETIANGSCGSYPPEKKKFWAGIESNYSGTMRAYCCKNKSLTPQLTQSKGLKIKSVDGEKINVMAPPHCSCMP